MRPTRTNKIFAVILCGLIIWFPNCGKSPSAPDNTPPAVPSQNTMFVDLSFFKTNSTSQPIRPDTPQPKFNFLAALTVVTAFNAAVLIGLSIPAAATAAALSVEPQLKSDGKFHWNFSYPENNPTLTLELTAEVRPAAVLWEMLITSQLPPLEGFRWYEGQSDLDGSNGTWQFYDLHQPTPTVQTVLIEWELVADDDRTLTFANVQQGTPGFGDLLSYQLDGEDVRMVFYDAGEDDSVHVAWNTATGEGFIIAPNYMDGQQACWDSTQNDVSCPN